MSKVVCFDCEVVAYGTRDSLSEKGWCGFSGNLNGQRFTYYLCPIHHKPERIAELLMNVKNGK